MALRTDNDTTYPDDPRNPGRKIHQQDHDELAERHNIWEDYDPTDFVPRSGTAFAVTDHASWDVNAADNDEAFAAAISAAAAAGNGQILLPRLLKIGNVNHVVTPPCGLIGMGGGVIGAASTIKATHANSRVSFGDLVTPRFGGISQGFLVDGDGIATQPLYLGIVSSPVFLGVDVRGSTAAGVNLLLEGTQNGYCHINSYNGGTLCKLDKGAFTNYFPKVEFSDAARYHLHFGTGIAPVVLGSVGYTAYNVFDAGIFERAATGNLGAVLHEAGLHNKLRDMVLAGPDIPTFIKMTKGAAFSNLFHLNNVVIDNGSPLSATGIDIAAACSAIFEGGSLSLNSLLNGIVYADSAAVEEHVSPTFSSVTNQYVGTAAFRQTVFRQNLRNGLSFVGDDAVSYPIDIRIDGDARERLRVYANGDVYRGAGAVAPVKILGAQGAAVAAGVNSVGVPTKAEFDALVAVVNALRDRLQASTGHGLFV